MARAKDGFCSCSPCDVPPYVFSTLDAPAESNACSVSCTLSAWIFSDQVCLHSPARVKKSSYIASRLWWGKRAVPCVLYFTQPAAHGLQSADLLTRLSLWWPLLSGSSYFTKMAPLTASPLLKIIIRRAARGGVAEMDFKSLEIY